MNTLTAPPISAARSAPPWVPNRGAAEAITLRGVSKSYRAVPAVRDLSLTVRRGETTALLGPNGAGKSTTIGMILGLLAPDRGSVTVLGTSADEAVAAGRVGAMLQDGGMMSNVRVAELLRMLAALYPNPLQVETALGLCQLDGLEKRRVDRLSGGQTQKLRLAVSLIGNPDLLILDEPTAGMDVEARRRFWSDMNAEADRGRTILFSTHYLEEADTNGDRIVVIANGQVVADGTPEAIKDSVGLRAVRFTAPQAATLPILGLGVFTAILPLLSPEKGDQMAVAVQGLLLLVSGVYYPLQVLPAALRVVGDASPLTYTLSGLRGALLNGAGVGELTGTIGLLLGIGVVLITAGFAAFGRAEARAKRLGLLKRSG